MALKLSQHPIPLDDFTLLDVGTIENLHGSMKELAEGLFKFFVYTSRTAENEKKYGNDRLHKTELG